MESRFFRDCDLSSLDAALICTLPLTHQPVRDFLLLLVMLFLGSRPFHYVTRLTKVVCYATGPPKSALHSGRASLSSPPLLGVYTDIEGNGEYFKKLVRKSKVLLVGCLVSSHVSYFLMSPVHTC